jgi:hypothetical protein
MNRTFRRILPAVAAGLGLTVSAWAATNPNARPNPNAAPTFDARAPKKPPVIITPPSGEVLAEAVKAEMDAYVRRLDVCTRLRQIALQANDDALATQADELERQASALYQQRVARLGLKGDAPPRAAEQSLDRKLGSGAAVDPLKVAPPQPVDRTITAGRASR